MKQHSDTVPHTNAQRQTYPAGGKMLLAALFFLLGLSAPLLGQSSAAMESPGQEVAGEETCDVGESAEVPADPAETDRIACFDRAWSAYQEDVWFYGDKGERTVPAMNRDWLVVRLFEKQQAATAPSPGVFAVAGDFPEPSFDAFNARYGEYFSHFLHDPTAAPAMAAYRLRRDMPEDVFRTLMTRLQQDRQVRYVHPAWKIADRLYAPLEKIDIVWKTASDREQRRALLDAVGAIVSDDSAAANPQQIAIDPCKQSVWQSANLLADDILVEQARPLLMVLEPPVGVRFELEMNGATPGTAIPFTFEVRFSDRVKIESSTIANLHIKPAGIFNNLYDIRYDTPLSSIDTSRSPIRITGQIKIYATGEYSLPGIPVYYTDKSAPKSRVQMVKTAAEPVRIAAIIPAAPGRFELQVANFGNLTAPPPALASTVPSVFLIIGGLVLLGLSASAGWMLRRSYRQPQMQMENHSLQRSRTRFEAAVSALQRYKRVTELADLGVCLKAYLAELAGLHENRRGGSSAAFLRRIEAALPETFRSEAAELLSLVEDLLARGDKNAMPEDLADRAGRLVENLRGSAEPCQDVTNTP